MVTHTKTVFFFYPVLEWEEISKYLPLHSSVCKSDGMMALPSGFSPFVEFSDECQQWRWIGKHIQTQQYLA